MSPIPYNIFGGDILWLAMSGESFQSSADQDKGFSWLEANIPQVKFGNIWNHYYI